MAVAERWEKAVRLASDWELTQNRSQKILDEVADITKTIATQELTKRLLDNLLKNTIGEDLKGENFQKFCADWLSGKRGGGATSLSTLKRYKPILEGFLAHLPEKRRRASIASITVAEIEGFRNSEIQVGKTAGTANFGVKVLRGVFSTARRQGIIPTNPAEAVELLPEETEERIPFHESQIRTLLKVADLEWRGMILLGYHCGIRLGDVANLTWANIDLLNRRLTFQARKTAKRKKTSDKDSVVYLHSDVMSYLESLRVNDDPKAPLFPSLYGRESGSYGGLSNAFSRLMENAGVRPPMGVAKNGKGRQFRALGYHSLRHSFISRLANAQVPADVRKEIVGHSSDDIHRRYTHLSLALQEKAIGGLSSVL